MRREWHEKHRDETEQWWAERHRTVTQLWVTEAGGSEWWVQQTGGVCFWCGERRSDIISRGYRRLPAGRATVHPCHDKCRWCKASGMFECCHFESTMIQKKKETISLLLAGSAKDTIAEQRQWITTLKNKLLHFHLCKLNQFGLLCCISHS